MHNSAAPETLAAAPKAAACEFGVSRRVVLSRRTLVSNQTIYLFGRLPFKLCVDHR
jgi:hypothetical protein